MTTTHEALREAVAALKEMIAWANCKPGTYPGGYPGTKAASAIAKAEEALKHPPLQPIYFMRENHTFRKLSDEPATALAEVEQEFNQGQTYGTVFSKRNGFEAIHAKGSANRLEFLAKCKLALEAAPQPSEQPAEWVGLTYDEVNELARSRGLTTNVASPWFHKDCQEISDKLREKNSRPATQAPQA